MPRNRQQQKHEEEPIEKWMPNAEERFILLTHHIIQAQLIFICSLKWDRKSFYFSCHFKKCSNYFLLVYRLLFTHGIEFTKREPAIKEPHIWTEYWKK